MSFHKRNEPVFSSSLFVFVKTMNEAISLSDAVPQLHHIGYAKYHVFELQCMLHQFYLNLGGQAGCPPSFFGASICVFISIHKVTRDICLEML